MRQRWRHSDFAKGSCLHLLLAHRLALERDLVRAVHDAIEDLDLGSIPIFSADGLNEGPCSAPKVSADAARLTQW